MITLNDVLTDLTYGEFQHLKVGNFHPQQHDSEPDPRAYAQLTRHVNKALTAIFTRFPLRWQEVDIQLSEEITDYLLHPDYTTSTGTAPVLYIMDTVMEPFQDNVAKIEEVYDEEGNLLHMNDIDEPLSVFTPRNNLIQVPWPNDFNMISVMYRALHPKIEYAYGMDPTTIELELPEQFMEPLLFYVAARYMATLPGQEGPSFYSKYNAQMEYLNAMGLYPQSEQSNSRFTRRGFV